MIAAPTMTQTIMNNTGGVLELWSSDKNFKKLYAGQTSHSVEELITAVIYNGIKYTIESNFDFVNEDCYSVIHINNEIIFVSNTEDIVYKKSKRS